MTEEEAKTKWCPFSRFKFASTSDNPSCNREGGPKDDGRGDNPWLVKGTRCLGSACMAWRGKSEQRYSGVGGAAPGPGFSPSFVEAAEWGENKEQQVWNRLSGYCGLAGEPK